MDIAKDVNKLPGKMQMKRNADYERNKGQETIPEMYQANHKHGRGLMRKEE